MCVIHWYVGEGVIQGLGERRIQGRIIQEVVREDVIKVCVGGGRGRGNPEVWRTSFITVPRPEDFKTILHFAFLITCV